jgi:adenosylcobinamide-GDP ribazoletransferase
MRSFIAAFRFLTRLPMPGPDTRVEDLTMAVAWFPLVGAIVGFATAGVFALSLKLWPSVIAAALAVAFGLLLTGGFHEDGFTDAVDGLGGGFTREKVLAIMKDSRIGAYGAMALWVNLMLRWACLMAFANSPRQALIAFPLAMVWGRWSIALMLRLLPPIAEGLAKEVHKRSGWMPFLASSALLLCANGIAWKLQFDHLIRTMVGVIIAALIYVMYLKRRLGGQSGDLLGAGNQIVETVALLAVLAR